MPWNFGIFDDVKEQRVVHMKTADYTILGHEKDFCIERKRNTGEISLNLGIKSVQFENEMIRMQTFQRRIIICEFTGYHLLEFPKYSNIPKKIQKRIRINGKFLYRKLIDLTAQYNVELCFTNNKDEAQQLAIDIMREYVKEKS
jgi:hypothetical protein